jgi:hypothetical protein
MLELFYRMRNATKNIYEYIWQENTEPRPTVLPNHPLDDCDQAATAIIEERTV